MSEFENAFNRAHSRASILQNLQDSHKKKKEQEALVSNMKSEPPVSQMTSSARAAEIVTDCINDKSFRTKQFITDMINGKQIVLDSTKNPSDSAKAIIKAKIKKTRMKVLSNKKLKKLGLCSPLRRPLNDEVVVLHDLWWQYAKEVTKNCQSEAQLQAKIHACDLVGARVSISESVSSSLVGVKGIVTAVSKNCLYLLVDTVMPRVYSPLPLPASTTADDSGEISNRKRKKLDRKQFIADRNNGVHKAILGSNAVHESTAAPVRQTSPAAKNNYHRPVLGCILRVVREFSNFAVFLPSAAAAVASQFASAENLSVFGEESASVAKTPTKSSGAAEEEYQSSSSSESESESSGDSDDDSGGSNKRKKPQRDEDIGSLNITGRSDVQSNLLSDGNIDTAAATKEPLVVFDKNEKDSDRLCIFYGKHYMPHCKYGDDVDK